MPDIEDAHRQGRAVIDVIESAGSAHVPIDRQRNILSAMAAVSRCRALLLGILQLDQAGRVDLVGVLLRALLEVWYFGVIALLGDDDDLKRLEEDHRYWKNALAQGMPGIIGDEGPEKAFTIYQRAKRADELLAQNDSGGRAGDALEWYRTIYAAESLTNAHAGFESLKPYVFEDEEGAVGVAHEPEIDEGLRYGRLRIAAVLTALLAKWTWDRVGLGGTRFDEIEGLGDTS